MSEIVASIATGASDVYFSNTKDQYVFKEVWENYDMIDNNNEYEDLNINTYDDFYEIIETDTKHTINDANGVNDINDNNKSLYFSIPNNNSVLSHLSIKLSRSDIGDYSNIIDLFRN